MKVQEKREKAPSTQGNDARSSTASWTWRCISPEMDLCLQPAAPDKDRLLKLHEKREKARLTQGYDVRSGDTNTDTDTHPTTTEA